MAGTIELEFGRMNERSDWQIEGREWQKSGDARDTEREQVSGAGMYELDMWNERMAVLNE